MTPARFRILLAGVGGQGVLTAARVLGAAASAAGLPVVVGQLHGMSQRGGSVEATVIIGPERSSFLVGAADVVVGFEPLEALRAISRIGPATSVVVSRSAIVPLESVIAGETYPPVDAVVADLRARTARVVVVDGPAIARRSGAGRTLNVALLGALAGLGTLPFSADALRRAAVDHGGPRFRDANGMAFDLGGREAAGV